jgi:hypothetical protein
MTPHPGAVAITLEITMRLTLKSDIIKPIREQEQIQVNLLENLLKQRDDLR